jgi:hypothetical protein
MLIPLSLGAFPIVFWAVRRSARKQEPLKKGSSLEFGIARGPKLLIGVVLLLLIAFTIFIFIASFNVGEGIVAALIPIAVLIAIVMALPTAIVVDNTGVTQRRLLFADRHTSWTDISTVTADANRGRTIIWSNDGKIAAVFSWFLAGRREIEQEIRAHAKHAVFERE